MNIFSNDGNHSKPILKDSYAVEVGPVHDRHYSWESRTAQKR